jgi:hypothetical protein
MSQREYPLDPSVSLNFIYSNIFIGIIGKIKYYIPIPGGSFGTVEPWQRLKSMAFLST